MKYVLKHTGTESDDPNAFLTVDFLAAAATINQNAAYILDGDKGDPDAMRLAELYRIVVNQTKLFLDSLEK